MAKVSFRNGLIVVLVSLGLASCGRATQYDYEPEADQMKPGRGLFSGKGGEFVILGRSAGTEEKKSGKTKSPAK